MPLKPFTERLREIREERGLSRDRLSFLVNDVDSEGSGGEQLKSVETGRRRPSLRTMAAICDALDLPPETFPEYRLALARYALDETEVGLDRAIENLEASGLEPVDVDREAIKATSRRRRRAVGQGQERAEETVRRARPRRRSRSEPRRDTRDR